MKRRDYLLSRVKKTGIINFLILLFACHAYSSPGKATPKNPIPDRSKQANLDMIDLSEYYNVSLDDDWFGKPGANLASLPKGVQAFAEAAFDVRGLIQIAGKAANAESGVDFPQAIKGIKINRTGPKLHFLHGTAWSVEENTKIGEYVLHYANGTSKTIPILYQRHAKDWWIKDGDPVLTDADIAWTGENEAARKLGYNIQLYKYTANNPLPDEEIAALDFVSAMTESGPFLVALTIEPLEPVYEGFKPVTIDNAIIARSPEAGPNLVDLSDYYNASLDDDWFQHPGHDLQDVPKGVQKLGDVSFDLRGLIQVAASKTLDVTGVVFPEAVKGIPVNRKGRRLHFLQACFWNAEEGAKLGEYVIHYSDGQTRSAPIIYGKNILDWWVSPEGGKLSDAKVAWTGSNPSTRAMNMDSQLIDYTWENPLPDVEISSVDLISDLIDASPFLVAITVE